MAPITTFPMRRGPPLAEQGIYTKYFARATEALCEPVYGGKAYNGTSIRQRRQPDAGCRRRQVLRKDGLSAGYQVQKRILSITRRRRMRSARMSRQKASGADRRATPCRWEWLYDPATFQERLLRMLQDEGQSKALEIASQAQQAWRDRVQSRFNTVTSKPGLSGRGFLSSASAATTAAAQGSGPHVPESDFKKKYIVPINRNIADKTPLENIKNRRAFLRQPAGTLAEQGKGLYPRAFYIPAIASNASRS